jgi:hypothetical protein
VGAMSGRLPTSSARARCGVALLLWLCPLSAVGKPLVAVLAFGGEEGEAVRQSIVEPLRKRYQVVHGQKLLDACDQLGVSMSRGPNLAKAAAHIGAVAVIGGTIKGGQLTMAVYSGKSGQPLVTGSVPCAGALSGKSLGKALALLLRGLAKAPKKVGKGPPLAPAPTPTPTGSGKGGGGKGGGKGGGALVFEPDPVEGSDGGKSAQREEMDEDPLVKSGSGGGAAAAPPTPLLPPLAPVVAKKPEEAPGTAPKVYLTLGMGTWLRRFEMNEPVGRAPKYDSGATFALRLDLGVRPVAFFSDGFLGNFFLHFRFQQTLGLESLQKAENKTYSTVLREIVFDFGYAHRLGSAAWAPYLGGGLGGGVMDFSIDYGRAVNYDTDMPNAGYRFLLLDVFVRWPFLAFLGAHFAFDYRVVLGSGDIQEDQWYGPASTGGINIALGIDATWKKIIASFEYNYSRYFYSFTDAEARSAAGKKVAGGALDQQHGILFNIGYSY